VLFCTAGLFVSRDGVSERAFRWPVELSWPKCCLKMAQLWRGRYGEETPLRTASKYNDSMAWCLFGLPPLPRLILFIASTTKTAMRFSFLLLLCAQSIASVVAYDTRSNIPASTGNTASRQPPGHEAIEKAKPEPEFNVPRDAPPHWSCSAKEGTNLTKTEEFLAGKVKPGSKFFHFMTDGKVSGWWHLVLDDEAKKAVENYEDITYFTPGGKKAEYYRALPPNDPSPNSAEISHSLGLRAFIKPPTLKHNSLEHDTRLIRRSGEWEKQINADRALRMDSQYK
jgi:hypothetical protein